MQESLDKKQINVSKSQITSIIYLALKLYLGMQRVCNKKTCVNVTDIVSFYLKPKLLHFSFQ